MKITARLGVARQGWASQGEAERGKARLGIMSKELRDYSGVFWAANAMLMSVGPGPGKAGRGGARRGVAWRGKVRQGEAGLGFEPQLQSKVRKS